jgi:hypothetical protein
MIERLHNAAGAFGFKVTGTVTAADIQSVEPQIRHEIDAAHKHPIGILLDLTGLENVEWKARWEELRFLHKFGGPIARVAVIGARTWEELMGDLAGATVLMQADIRYFLPSELPHAWHWVKTAKHAEDLPVRQIIPPGHLMSGYNPEYTDL